MLYRILSLHEAALTRLRPMRIYISYIYILGKRTGHCIFQTGAHNFANSRFINSRIFNLCAKLCLLKFFRFELPAQFSGLLQ